jgi:hypothetical protein
LLPGGGRRPSRVAAALFRKLVHHTPGSATCSRGRHHRCESTRPSYTSCGSAVSRACRCPGRLLAVPPQECRSSARLQWQRGCQNQRQVQVQVRQLEAACSSRSRRKVERGGGFSVSFIRRLAGQSIEDGQESVGIMLGARRRRVPPFPAGVSARGEGISPRLSARSWVEAARGRCCRSAFIMAEIWTTAAGSW